MSSFNYACVLFVRAVLRLLKGGGLGPRPVRLATKSPSYDRLSQHAAVTQCNVGSAWAREVQRDTRVFATEARKGHLRPLFFLVRTRNFLVRTRNYLVRTRKLLVRTRNFLVRTRKVSCPDKKLSCPDKKLSCPDKKLSCSAHLGKNTYIRRVRNNLRALPQGVVD
jgi:hypothetical protein